MDIEKLINLEMDQFYGMVWH